MTDDDTRDYLARLVRLETKVCLKFEEMEKATVLAREQIEMQRTIAKNDLDVRLEGMNQFRQQINRMEGSLVTKDSLTNELKSVREYTNGETRTLGARIDSLSKLVYMGLGIVIALQLVFKFFIK